MKQNMLILNVSWQPGLRIFENDNKSVDFDRRGTPEVRQVNYIYIYIYINNTPPPLEPGKMKNRAFRWGDPGETKPFC